MNKTLLVVIGCVVIGLIALVGGGVWWWKSNAEEIIGSIDTAIKAGHAEGAANDERGCLDLALKRHIAPENQGILASARSGMVLTACLEVSKPTPDFCKDVPLKSSPFEGAKWGQDACARYGYTDPYCPSLMQQVTLYCSSPQQAQKRSDTPAAKPAGEMKTMAPVRSPLLARALRANPQA